MSYKTDCTKMCIPKTAYFWVTLAILPNVIISAPNKNSAVKSISMYDVLVEKCPGIEKIDLKKSLSDIFYSKCTDWEAIDKLAILTEVDKTNAQCLLFYESLLSFCTQFGEEIVKFGELIKSSIKENFDFNSICFSENSLWKVKNTTHNLTNSLDPALCYSICYNKIEHGKPVPHNICNVAYFFGSFDVKKFLSVHSRLDKNQENAVLLSPNKPNIVHPESTVNKNASNDQEKTQEKIQLPTSNDKKDNDLKEKAQSNDIQKPKDIVNDLHNVKGDIVPPPQIMKVKNENNVVESNIVKAPPAQESETQNQPPKTEESEVVNEDKKPQAGESKDPVKDDKSKVAPDITQDINGDGKDPDDADQKSAMIQGDNDEKNDFVQQNERDYADDSGDDKEIDVPNHGLPDEAILEKKPTAKKGKPSTLDEEPVSSYNVPEGDMDGDSYFFSYFSVLMCLVIVGYVAYHNRQKVLALILEGKRGKRGSRTGRRPNSANYHKLDSNLEEAISSSCTKNSSNVIY